MANATDPSARHVHGADPQSLIDRIVRSRIYDSPYWKEHCFGLNAATVIDQAVLLTHIGGAHGAHIIPSPFLCLALKLLQIQPPLEAVEEFILQDQYKYLRLLGAFYYRLVGRGADVWRRLEGLLADYRRVKRRKEDGGWELVHVDEVVDELLQQDKALSVSLPRLMRRERLVQLGHLEPRRSPLMDILEREKEEEEQEGKKGGKDAHLLMPGDDEAKQKAAASSDPQPAAAPAVAVLPPPQGAATSTSKLAADEQQRPPISAKGRSRERERDRGDGFESRERRRDDDGRHRRREEERRRRRSVSSSRSRSPSRERRDRRRDDDHYDRRRLYEREGREEDRRESGRHHGHRRSPSYSRSRSRSRSPRRHRRRRSRS